MLLEVLWHCAVEVWRRPRKGSINFWDFFFKKDPLGPWTSALGTRQPSPPSNRRVSCTNFCKLYSKWEGDTHFDVKGVLPYFDFPYETKKNFFGPAGHRIADTYQNILESHQIPFIYIYIYKRFACAADWHMNHFLDIHKPAFSPRKSRLSKKPMAIRRNTSQLNKIHENPLKYITINHNSSEPVALGRSESHRVGRCTKTLISFGNSGPVGFVF